MGNLDHIDTPAKFRARVPQYLRNLEVALLRCTFDEARSIINRIEQEHREMISPKKLSRADSIYELERFGINVRYLNMLADNKILTIGELLQAGSVRVLGLRNCGTATVMRFRRSLKDAGFREWR